MKEIIKKWWFWVCLIIIILIIGFVIIMGIALFTVTSGIHEVAQKIQSIDNDATLYTSAGENIVVVEMPKYTDETKGQKKEDIVQIIQNYASNGNILNNYSKFMLITKIDNSNGNSNYLYCISAYSLPNMEEIESESKVYVDLVQITTESGNSSNVESESNNKEESQVDLNNYPNTKNEENNNSSNATMGQKNALSKAKSYLEYSAFSYDGLMKQLEFEGFSNEEAKYGVDNCGANWNEQAAKKAQSYLEYSSFSRNGLINQLEYEGFTSEQAEYGVSVAGY